MMEAIGIFEEVTYTVGILFAGFVMLPFTLGPGGNLLGISIVALYCLVVLPFKNDPEDEKIERRQNMWLNSKWRQHVSTFHKTMAPSAIRGAQNLNQMSSADSVSFCVCCLDRLVANPSAVAFAQLRPEPCCCLLACLPTDRTAAAQYGGSPCNSQTIQRHQLRIDGRKRGLQRSPPCGGNRRAHLHRPR